MGLHVVQQLLVDALGSAAERQLPERRQIARREVVLDRTLGGVGEVDLAFLEPLDQVVGGKIDDLDIVGLVDDGIWNRLADPDLGDLGDDIVQAFDMLDVECRVDVDALRQDFLDIQVALGMAAAGRVGVGEFVDQDQRRAPGEDGVDIHLVEDAPLVVDLPAGNISALDQGQVSLRPCVSTMPITTSMPSASLARPDISIS